MNPRLTLIFPLLLASCQWLSDEDLNTGIAITGTTLATQNGDIQVKYSTGLKDTLPMFNSARLAQAQTPILTSSNMDNPPPAQAKIEDSWNFANFDSSRFVGSNQHSLSFVGQPKWSSLSQGAVYTDSQTSLRLEITNQQVQDSLWIQAQVFPTDSLNAQSILTDSSSFLLRTDSSGTLVLETKDAAGSWHIQKSQVHIKSNRWNYLSLRFADQYAILNVDHQNADTLTFANKTQVSSKLEWAHHSKYKNFKAWLDYISVGQWHTLPSQDSLIRIDSVQIWLGQRSPDTLQNSGLINDVRDGQSYKWVKIGTQIWMAQNLNFGKFQDASTGALPLNSKYCPGNDSNNCKTMGALYAWNVAMNLNSFCDSSSCQSQIQSPKHQGICPTGWHIPTKVEWETLAANIGGIGSGSQLKSKTSGYANWDDDNSGTALFNALPTGFIWSKAAQKFGTDALFWAVDEFDNLGNAYGFALYTNDPTLTNNTGDWKVTGEAIRCIKD